MSKGGWSFSSADHGWPGSDTTATGLKVNIAHQYMKQDSFSLIYFPSPS